ncbi:hypothetical protein PHISCL_10102, partial [Aspergillus sclerotialis]
WSMLVMLTKTRIWMILRIGWVGTLRIRVMMTRMRVTRTVRAIVTARSPVRMRRIRSPSLGPRGSVLHPRRNPGRKDLVLRLSMKLKAQERRASWR